MRRTVRPRASCADGEARARILREPDLRLRRPAPWPVRYRAPCARSVGTTVRMRRGDPAARPAPKLRRNRPEPPAFRSPEATPEWRYRGRARWPCWFHVTATQFL